MEKWKLTFILFCLVLCTSCNRERTYRQNMISAYIRSNSVSSGCSFIQNRLGIACTFNGEWYSKGQGQSRYEEYSTLFGDTAWWGIHELQAVMVADTFLVSITCNKNFDAAHPKGTLLNDLCRASYDALGKYILNGYKNDSWYSGMLADSENMISNFDFLSIYFSSLPENKGEYEFTVEFQNTKKTITSTCSINY